VGTKVCFDGDCNEEICIYDGIARSTGKCDTYSESFSSGSCTKSGSYGDATYKTCRYAYRQKAISSSGTYTSNYVYSSSKEAMDACKLNVKNGYACEDTPTRTYTYTCTSSTTSDCPATHPWVTSTTCYKTTGLTDGTYSCSSGTLVATNRCVTSSSPKADLVCPDPDNYVKIKQTDKFCVNKSDYRSARLTCPGYGSSSSGGGLTK
jgi:hypothetical protein